MTSNLREIRLTFGQNVIKMITATADYVTQESLISEDRSYMSHKNSSLFFYSTCVRDNEK